jgi:nicotinate-nucleotide adenylyltransferase
MEHEWMRDEDYFPTPNRLDTHFILSYTRRTSLDGEYTEFAEPFSTEADATAFQVWAQDQFQDEINQFQLQANYIIKRVALYGGAFNPIHEGHIAVAQFLLNRGYTDEVWILPDAISPFGKSMTSEEDRLAMCRLAAASDARLYVSDYMITNQCLCVDDLVTQLLGDPEFQNQYAFSFVVGQDAMDRFEEWVNHAELKNKIRFLVMPRTGVNPPTDDVWYMHPPHMYIRTETQIPAISSTQIREALRNNNTPFGLNANVWQYIQTHQLF